MICIYALHVYCICQCYFSIFEILSNDFIIVIINNFKYLTFLFLYFVFILIWVIVLVILLCFCLFLNKTFSFSYFSTS